MVVAGGQGTRDNLPEHLNSHQHNKILNEIRCDNMPAPSQTIFTMHTLKQCKQGHLPPCHNKRDLKQKHGLTRARAYHAKGVDVSLVTAMLTCTVKMQIDCRQNLQTQATTSQVCTHGFSNAHGPQSMYAYQPYCTSKHACNIAGSDECSTTQRRVEPVFSLRCVLSADSIDSHGKLLTYENLWGIPRCDIPAPCRCNTSTNAQNINTSLMSGLHSCHD